MGREGGDNAPSFEGWGDQLHHANANGHASEQPVFEQTLEKPEYGWPSGSAYLVFPRLLSGWQYQVSLTIRTTVGTVPALGPRTVTVEAGSLAVPTGPEAPHAWVLHRWVADGQEEDGSPKVAEALAAGWRNVAPEGAGLYTLTVSEDGQSVPLTEAPVTGESALILDTSDLIRWCDPIAPPPQDLVVTELGGTGTTGVILPRPVPDLCVEPATGVAFTYTWASYGTDHLGTVRAVYTENPEGTTGLQTFDYEPFGVEIPGGNVGCSNTHKFTGQERDAETGNDNFHARFYGGSMGRFMRPDPLAFGTQIKQSMGSPQSWNLYAYVGGNPINFLDPLGLWAISVSPADAKTGKVTITVNKSKKDDNIASLVKQLGFTGKAAQQLAEQLTKKFGDSDGIQLSKASGVVGRTFRTAENGLTEQAKYEAKGGGDKPGPYNALYDDCSMTSAKIAFPSQMPDGSFKWAIPKTNALLEGRESLSSWDNRTGDIVRWGTGNQTHFANVLMTDDNGKTKVFSRSGREGKFEITTEDNPGFAVGYGPITGEFRAEE